MGPIGAPLSRMTWIRRPACCSGALRAAPKSDGWKEAAELVAARPDVIFAAGVNALVALQRATRTVPIVFAQIPEPVDLGFVASIPRPGGNSTGFALFEVTIAVKWLELLKELAPHV